MDKCSHKMLGRTSQADRRICYNTQEKPQEKQLQQLSRFNIGVMSHTTINGLSF